MRQRIKNKNGLIVLTGSVFMLLFFLFSLFLISSIPTNANVGDTIYVDASTTGDETGTRSNPFKTIEEALDEADDNEEVEVQAGTYRENVTIPKDVTLSGEYRDEVFIVAKSKYSPTVRMRDGSKLNSLTVMGGRHGVYVKSGSKATIEDCVISYNEDHGIKIKRSDLSDENAVVIEENIIQRNNGSGIYAQKRMVTIYNNSIYSNEKDGIYLQGEVAADVSYNKIKYNEKSGIDIMIDSSTIFIGNNTFKNNEQSGVDVHAKSWRGKALIKDSKFYHNDEYGIRKIQYGSPNWDIWDYDFMLGAGNLFVDNKKGEISSVKMKE